MKKVTKEEMYAFIGDKDAIYTNTSTSPPCGEWTERHTRRLLAKKTCGGEHYPYDEEYYIYE